MLITLNYLRYWLEILTLYGGHVGPSAYQTGTKVVHRWHFMALICIHILPLKSFLHLYISTKGQTNNL